MRRFILVALLLCLCAANAAARKRIGDSTRSKQVVLPNAVDGTAIAVPAEEAQAATSESTAAVLVPTALQTDDQPPAAVAVEAIDQQSAHAAEEPVLEMSVDPEATTAGVAQEDLVGSDATATERESSTSAVGIASTTTTYDVVVVGAGLSGLKAAADLKAAGYSVVVLEGRNRTGGRVFSTTLAGSSTPVEVGAQWLHGTNPNAVYSLVRNTMGIIPQTTAYSNSLHYTTNSSLVAGAAISGFESLYDSFISFANQGSHTNSVSVKTVLDAFLASRSTTTLQKQGLAYCLNTNVEQEFAASASSLSVNLYDEGVNLNGGDFVLPLGQPLSKIPDYLASSLTGNSAVKLNTNVTNVAYNTTGVTVTAVTAGSTTKYHAKAAIVTVPLGVLKQRGSSFFSPPLSTTKQNAITRLGMGLLNKVILRFPANYTQGPFGSTENVWWINRLPVASGDNGYWQEFFVLKKAYNIPILVAFQAGNPAVTAETTMTDAATVQSVMGQLRIWYPTIPAPVSSYVTRWWRDPWAFGSYSYQSTACTGTERKAFTSPQAPTGSTTGRVWFAGEHVSINTPSTMQGAFSTGQAAATAVRTAHPLTG